MIRPTPLGLLVGLVLAVAALSATAWFVSASELPSLIAGQDEPANKHASKPTPSDTVADDALDTLEALPGTVWRAVRVPLGIGALAMIAMLAVRWRSRRSRRYVRLALLPFRAEQAQPEAVRRMIETWHQQLLMRWWRRPLRGQASLALEIITGSDASGEMEGRLSVVCPESRAGAVEGALLGCYQDSALSREVAPMPAVRRVVRLKKRAAFVHALRSPEDSDTVRNAVDALLNQMASLDRPSVFQLTLTPTPALFDRYARWRYRSLERVPTIGGEPDPTQAGLRSEVLREELRGALRVQHRPLFFADLRIGATSYDHCAAIAGTVRGEAGAENRLVERYMRPWGRSPLYLRRLRMAIANPLPNWRRGVLSSSEVAGLWRLPEPGLKFARLARSPVPRMPATPEVSRAETDVLMRDERGPVGIRAMDKSDGLGLIGGQKTGKTSVLCRTVQADARDEDCAVVVLMPKPGDALTALSMVPEGRTVHHLDLENPEFGINPLIDVGDPAVVADRIVDAFRDVNAEGDIRGSSDRFLRQAAQAAIGASRSGVVDGPPTLWHMYRILIPAERAFRERVVEALYPDPRFIDTATFFGRELPSDLEQSPGQTAAKLDAPRNKLLRLMVESLDKVLRHPMQISIEDIVRRREILIVDGKMGTFGADNCRVMMQFILTSLYGALQRQQQLPESERVRVALKVDEAHLILTESFANAMATLRSGGLEVVAAWQYGEQIQDPKIRAGMMSLLRQRCMFSMGEQQDAREISSIAMAAYSDMIRPDSEARALLRVTPDMIFNLPNHHAICSWISRGARVPAFLGKTIALSHDEAVIEHHLAAQRARGCVVPDQLPDPLPDLDWTGLGELPSADLVSTAVTTNGHAEAAAGPVEAALAEAVPAVAAPSGEALSTSAVPAPIQADALELDHGATSVDRPNERAPAPPAALPDSFTELDFDGVRGMQWDNVAPMPRDRWPEPTQRELEILAALWSHRFLFATQMHRRWWSDSSLRAAQQGLNRMTRAGWVRRFRFQLAERGAQQRVYCLARPGFELAQQRRGRHGTYIDEQARWREPEISDPRRVLRDLHVNGWVLAFEKRAGKIVKGWRGPREGRLAPPRRKVRGEWLDLEPRDVLVGASHRLRDFGAARFEPVSPDATLELRVAAGDSSLRFDLLVEMERRRPGGATADKLVRYDGLISGWSGMLNRYKTLGTPPMVVFVCDDEPALMSLIKLADRTLTTRLAKPGSPESEWPHPARRAMFFAVARDIHVGSLEALQLPDESPDVRARLRGKDAGTFSPKRVHLIEPKLIDMA